MPGRAPEISITSMIDVMMSLLIIFLVIQPAMRKGLDLQVPTTDAAAGAQAPPDRLVLEVQPGPRFVLNAIPIPAERLGAGLREVFSSRARRVLFVKGGAGVRYADVLAAVDSARGAGVSVVGLVPRAP
jgi:biopolymer transport protein ExbD